MRLLHTADLHLKKGEDERFDVLAWLIGKAGEIGVDYFVIAGDLFDSDTDATVMRQRLRGVFDSAKCKFIVIPGNHDEHSFGADFEYGKNVIQLTDKPYQIVEAGDVKICGIPYQHKRFSECIKDLPSGIDILIAHGTLYDPLYIFSLLDDPETEYMPMFPSDLRNIARYAAMGHLHASFIELTYGGTRVIYPGSPIALGKKCEGERSYCLVEIDGDRVEIKKCSVENAPYWVTGEFFVYPEAEQRILSDIEKFLNGIDDPMVMPNVVATGYIAEKEKEFLDALESIRKKYEKKFRKLDLASHIQSWEKVISNPIVRRFVVKTADLEDSIRMKVFDICLPIFDRVLK
ncbi:MAG: DNA repair exonuclease [candidate division WOR-3 bacterium]|nr:DNA repair exonuclease [candidate division WOR-3 bacterium]